MNKYVLISCLLLFLVLRFGPEFFLKGNSNVISISDGDTITVLLQDKTQLKVRLAEIDCPEKNQPFGNKAKQLLGDKIFGKVIDVKWTKKDRYGRAIGKVYLNGRYINKEMIEEGFAWNYTSYSRSTEMAEAQEKAKRLKAGIWSEKNPIPPWEFRKK